MSEPWHEQVSSLPVQPRREGHRMPNKIEIRPLDKKETTGDSGGNGGS